MLPLFENYDDGKTVYNQGVGLTYPKSFLDMLKANKDKKIVADVDGDYFPVKKNRKNVDKARVLNYTTNKYSDSTIDLTSMVGVADNADSYEDINEAGELSTYTAGDLLSDITSNEHFVVFAGKRADYVLDTIKVYGNVIIADFFGLGIPYELVG